MDNEVIPNEWFDQNSEEEMLFMITQRVSELLSHSPDLLFSYLYRLDVEEVKINEILSLAKNVPADQALALLIWERQKERLATKKKYKQPPIDGWEDF